MSKSKKKKNKGEPWYSSFFDSLFEFFIEGVFRIIMSTFRFFIKIIAEILHI